MDQARSPNTIKVRSTEKVSKGHSMLFRNLDSNLSTRKRTERLAAHHKEAGSGSSPPRPLAQRRKEASAAFKKDSIISEEKLYRLVRMPDFLLSYEEYKAMQEPPMRNFKWSVTT